VSSISSPNLNPIYSVYVLSSSTSTFVQLMCYSTKLYEIVRDRFTPMKNLFRTLKHVPCDGFEDYELMETKIKIVQNLGIEFQYK
jgi:hypothetical protein